MESQSTFGIARHVVVGVVVVVGNSCREGADVRAVRGIVWVQNGHNGTISLRPAAWLAVFVEESCLAHFRMQHT